MTTRPNALKQSMLGMQDTPKPQIVPAQATSAETPSNPVVPSRQGKRVISGYFDSAAYKQMRLLSVETDRSIQSLLEEAINDLFKKHGKSAVA